MNESNSIPVTSLESLVTAWSAMIERLQKDQEKDLAEGLTQAAECGKVAILSFQGCREHLQKLIDGAKKK